MPKFSIIIPVYNVAPYLRECLDSVLAQTFTDWEAICVDDGSTDGSGAILDEYAAKDGRFRVIHQKNAGVSAARNVALDVAVGEWVWFVDADDKINPKSLRVISREVKLHLDVQVVFISYKWGGDSDWSENAEAPEGVTEYFSGITSESTANFFRGSWMLLLQRSTIGKSRFLSYMYNEDANFVMEVCWKGAAFLKIHTQLYFYRQNPTSATHKKFSYEDVRKIFESERLLFEMVRTNTARFPQCDCSRLFSSLRQRMYKSYFGAYFELGRTDRQKLLKEWIALQELFRGYCLFSKELRVRLFLIKALNSARFISLIAFGSPPGWWLVKRIYARIMCLWKRNSLA